MSGSKINSGGWTLLSFQPLNAEVKVFIFIQYFYKSSRHSSRNLFIISWIGVAVTDITKIFSHEMTNCLLFTGSKSDWENKNMQILLYRSQERPVPTLWRLSSTTCSYSKVGTIDRPQMPVFHQDNNLEVMKTDSLSSGGDDTPEQSGEHRLHPNALAASCWRLNKLGLESESAVLILLFKCVFAFVFCF